MKTNTQTAQECTCKLNPCYSIQCECSLHNFVHGHCQPEQPEILTNDIVTVEEKKDTNLPEAAEWEEKFDEIFLIFKEREKELGILVKQFIRSLLASQKQQYIERIRILPTEPKKWLDPDKGARDWYIEANDDAIKAIEE